MGVRAYGFVSPNWFQPDDLYHLSRLRNSDTEAVYGTGSGVSAATEFRNWGSGCRFEIEPVPRGGYVPPFGVWG